MVFKPILFLCLYILFHYSSLFFLKDSSSLPTVSNTLVSIANLISLIVMLKAFTRQNHQIKKLILLLFLGALCNFIGSCYWTYYEYVYGIPPLVGVYDLSMLFVYIFFLWALIHYFRTHKVVLATTYLLDILIFSVITSTLSWVFIIRPLLLTTLDTNSLLIITTYLSYPIADLSVLFACLVILLCTPISKSMLYMVVGFLINIIANSINFYESIHTAYPGHLIDPLWSISILLIGFSGLDAFKENHLNKRTYSKKYLQFFIPYTAVIIFLFVVYVNFYDVRDPLLIGVFISIVLLLIRLFNTINRNEVLNNVIHQKNRQLKEANDKLKFLAYHDELTQLPNRHFLFEKLQNKMNGTHLLFIDLDGFKSVNDTYGHTVGDILLQQVSARLKEQLTADDFLCRFAGDEFIILLSNKDQMHVEIMAAAIVESLSHRYIIDTHEISISSSIGISSFEENESMLSAINRADKAMYTIKKNGKNGFQFI